MDCGPACGQDPCGESTDEALDALSEVVRRAVDGSPATLRFLWLAVCRWSVLIAGIRAIRALLTLSTGQGSDGRFLRSRLGRRRGLLPTGRLAVAVLALEGDPALVLRGRSRKAVRTNLRRAEQAGLVARRVDDPQVQARCLRELIATRGWDPTTQAFLARTHQVAPGVGRHYVVFAADGGVLAMAVVRVSAGTALLVWHESSHQAASSDARYALMVALLQDLCGQVQYVATGSSLGLRPGLRYFQRRLGFRPYRLLRSSSSRARRSL